MGQGGLDGQDQTDGRLMSANRCIVATGFATNLPRAPNVAVLNLAP
jgi:hypothetical protein